MISSLRFQHAAFAVLVCAALVGCGGIGDVGSSSAVSSAEGGGAGANGRPTIKGQPSATIVVGQLFSFQPTVSDGQGDKLTFTASNLPAWMTLNAETGRITGTPQASDVATYSGITITVSDGTNTSTLGPFSITVAAMGSGRATLSWLPPTQNTDGSTLTDLAGYVVLYGGSPADLSQSISIDNPSIATYVVENLPSGTWYFAVQAVNASGVRSPDSTLASKTIS
jgi:hypothetical protein